MKMLLVFSLFSSVVASTIMAGGDSCSTTNGHPENGGYYITGFGHKKEDDEWVMAHEDPNDPSTYGEWGVRADDTEWTTGKDYQKAMPKSCTPYPSYGMFCSDITDKFEFLYKSTCAIMRFSFPADSGSTVHMMTGNDTFQACDFTGATELTDGGEFSDGTKYIDFIIEQDMIDTQYYFASKSGCQEGQKVAIAVGGAYTGTYEMCYNMGTETKRIQHCDCDHSIASSTLNEVCGTGFIDGCRSQMPTDLSCCPGDDAEYVRVGMGGNYMKGGSCIPKSQLKAKIQLAKEIYDRCTNPATGEATRAECDAYRAGGCAWYRVYNAGNWVYNTDKDGTETCDCTETRDGMAQCSQEGGNCATCMNMLAYGGDAKKMPDEPKYYGCDGANSTYDKFCLPWYMISHCLDVEAGKTVGEGFTGSVLAKIQADINVDECDASQDFAAYKMYSADTNKWVNFIENTVGDEFLAGLYPTPIPTPEPTTPLPTPVPSTAVPTPEPTAAKTTVEATETAETTVTPVAETDSFTAVAAIGLVIAVRA